MEVKEQDKQMFKAVRHLLEKGRFSLEWREASAFFAIQRWVADFDKRINETKEPEAKKEVKNGRKPKQ